MIKKIKIIFAIIFSSFIFNISNCFSEEVQLNNYIDPLDMVSASNSEKGISGTLAMASSKVLDQIFGILGIIALIIVILAGITYITSLGKPDKAKKGKDYMIWAVIGLVVIFLSYAVVKFVFEQILKLRV